MITAPVYIANWGRRPGQPMTDEQRRAMWARQGGSRGGNPQPEAPTTAPTMDEINARLRAQGIDVYDGDQPLTWWDMTKAALSGAWEGAKGGGVQFFVQ